MNGSVYSISLDLHHTVAPHVLPVKQGDTARYLNVSLTEDGAPYALTEDCTAILYAKLPDGTVRRQNMAVEKSGVFSVIPSDWTYAAGDVECEVRIKGTVGSASGKTVTSPKFSILVGEAVSGTPYAVYWDMATNPAISSNRRINVSDANFDLTLTSDGSEKYAWLLIPDEIVPSGGLAFLTEGEEFTDQGTMQKYTPEGTVTFRGYRTASKVTEDVYVAVREREG
ncbi:MAG: BppU family phage baseplate upper protein [Clostridia bacterium]|nr:BppU family phage baseplate upper protein [Clostridia bacterium]